MTCIKDECYLRDLLWQEAKQSSQKELAAKIKISPQYLSDIMGGNRAVPDVVARYYGYHGFMALCGWRLPPDSARLCSVGCPPDGHIGKGGRVSASQATKNPFPRVNH